MNELSKQKDSLLTFPCDFTIKIFGPGSEEFESAALMIINKHAPNLSDRVISSRLSENGNYRALSVTVNINSQEQLDNIYRDLSSSPQVLLTL